MPSEPRVPVWIRDDRHFSLLTTLAEAACRDETVRRKDLSSSERRIASMASDAGEIQEKPVYWCRNCNKKIDVRCIPVTCDCGTAYGTMKQPDVIQYGLGDYTAFFAEKLPEVFTPVREGASIVPEDAVPGDISECRRATDVYVSPLFDFSEECLTDGDSVYVSWDAVYKAVAEVGRVRAVVA